MLDPWVIEEIRRREEKKRREQERPYAPPPEPPAGPPDEHVEQPETERGPVEINIGGDDDEEHDSGSRSYFVNPTTISLI